MANFIEQFNYYGEVELLNQPKTVFFCPYDVTNDIFSHIRKWIASLDPMAGVIVCGNSTGIERFTLRLLINKGFAVVLPLATTIPGNLEEMNLGWKLSNEESTKMLTRAFDEHRLLLVSSKENVSVSTPTRKTILIRNEWMREVGNQFVVALGKEFDYFDRLLIGKQTTALSFCEAPCPDDAETMTARRLEATRMGWDIYRRLKDHAEEVTTEELNILVNRYLLLDIDHPSLLHSQILMVVAMKYTTRTDFDFQQFLRAWSIQNLRPEDWKYFRKEDGQMIPPLADRCLSRLFKQMPSRNLMSLHYEQPFDTALAHLWLDAVLQHSPKNMRHVRKALRLAYYEHDTEKINYYKQQLAV